MLGNGPNLRAYGRGRRELVRWLHRRPRIAGIVSRMARRKPQVASRIDVDGFSIEVVRKRIKHVNLRVYPPDGRVRVSAPHTMPERFVREVVRGRIEWIERQRARFASVPVPVKLEYVSGEVVPVLGIPHVLRFVSVLPGSPPSSRATDLPARTSPDAERELTVSVPAHADLDERRRTLEKRLRQVARTEFGTLTRAWAHEMGVPMTSVNVRRMTSRWGTCHVRTGKVFLNLALVTRPRECLTYVVVHELAHLIVPDHSREFWQTVERYLPEWRVAERRLAREPLWADPVWGR